MHNAGGTLRFQQLPGHCDMPVMLHPVCFWSQPNHAPWKCFVAPMPGVSWNRQRLMSSVRSVSTQNYLFFSQFTVECSCHGQFTYFGSFPRWLSPIWSRHLSNGRWRCILADMGERQLKLFEIWFKRKQCSEVATFTFQWTHLAVGHGLRNICNGAILCN